MAVTPPDPSAQFNVSNPNNQKTSHQKNSSDYHIKTKEVAVATFLTVRPTKSSVKKHSIKEEKGKGLSFLLNKVCMKQTADAVNSIFKKTPNTDAQKKASSLQSKITPPVSRHVKFF